MHRRDLLKYLMAAPLGMLPAAGLGRRRWVPILDAPLAGFQYHEGERVWPLLRRGLVLSLRREPGNVHDRRAVAVFAGRHKLGYVPRVNNRALTELMDRGEMVQAEIAELRVGPNPWRRVRLKVYLQA